MPTALDSAISALVDPAVRLADALRTLYVVTRRIDAVDASDWLERELSGYGPDDRLPDYRKLAWPPVSIRFDGPYGSRATSEVVFAELPDDLCPHSESFDLRQPVAELEELSRGADEPGTQLPGSWLHRYREHFAKGEAPGYAMMVPNRASVKIPRTHLLGILDRIKSNALDLAMRLESVDPNTGSAGGPTVGDDPRLARSESAYLAGIFSARESRSEVAPDGGA